LPVWVAPLSRPQTVRRRAATASSVFTVATTEAEVVVGDDDMAS
jgi:hypothetical protein